MNKIAFFYNLGYQMAKEAVAQPANIPAPSVLRQMARIWKTLLGMGRKEIVLPTGETLPLDVAKSYLENIGEAWRTAGTPAKALAVGLPAAGLGGAGYGTYKATRKKKSRLEKLLGL